MVYGNLLSSASEGPPRGPLLRRLGLSILLLAAVATSACTGEIGATGEDPRPGGGQGSCHDPSCFGTEGPVSSTAFPRLSHRQWGNTTRDLLGLSAPPSLRSTLTGDPPGSTEFDNDSKALAVLPGLWGDYQRAAEALAAEMTADEASLARLLPEGLPASGDARVQAFIERFGERAYRRPLTAEELARYVALFAEGPTYYASMDPFAAGVRLALEAFLQSPHFLYRVERGATQNDGTARLDAYALASRLSYALWDSMPDAELFEAAGAGELATDEGLAMQAARMLDDPRAEAKVAAFHRQLLELDRYDHLEREGLEAGVGVRLREETERFVHAVVFEEEGTLRDLFTAHFSFVNEETAPLYGVAGVSGDALVRVELDPNERAGLITQAGFLAARAGDTAPILRGVFINLKLLCADLPQPVAFEPPHPSGITRRERIDSITGPGTCGASCHAQVINPIGFALESFDDLGRFRVEDNGKAVDAYAEYAFADGILGFDGPVELANLLANRPEAHQCYVGHWLEFAYGRAAVDADLPIIRRLGYASRVEDLPVKALLLEIVRSPTFRTRLTSEET